MAKVIKQSKRPSIDYRELQRERWRVLAVFWSFRPGLVVLPVFPDRC